MPPGAIVWAANESGALPSQNRAFAVVVLLEPAGARANTCSRPRTQAVQAGSCPTVTHVALRSRCSAPIRGLVKSGHPGEERGETSYHCIFTSLVLWLPLVENLAPLHKIPFFWTLPFFGLVVASIPLHPPSHQAASPVKLHQDGRRRSGKQATRLTLSFAPVVAGAGGHPAPHPRTTATIHSPFARDRNSTRSSHASLSRA